MSKTAAKQRVSAKRVLRMGAVIVTIVHFTFISICAKVINDFY